MRIIILASEGDYWVKFLVESSRNYVYELTSDGLNITKFKYLVKNKKYGEAINFN